MPGGRSATRRTFSSSTSISTVGSRSRSPTRGAGKRPCDASPKPAARGHRFGFAGCSLPSYDHALRALRIWLDSWADIGRIAVGMAYQGYDLQLTRYDDRGWRATFYTTGMEHSPTSATGAGWEAMPWHATQRGVSVGRLLCGLTLESVSYLLVLLFPQSERAAFLTSESLSPSVILPAATSASAAWTTADTKAP
jgi:hypothetical protein